MCWSRGGEFGQPVRIALREAIDAHAELTRRMNDDALDAHAAGHIFAQLLGERIEACATSPTKCAAPASRLIRNRRAWRRSCADTLALRRRLSSPASVAGIPFAAHGGSR